MDNGHLSYLEKRRQEAYAAVAAEKERKAEAARRAEQDRRDAERLRLEKGSFVISILSLAIAAGALVISVIALVH